MKSLKDLKTNKEVENNGEWFWPAEDVGFQLKRAGGLNKEYNKVLAKLMKPHTQQYGKKQKEDDLDRLKVFGIAVIKACMVDWKGFPAKSAMAFSKSYHSSFNNSLSASS